MLYLPRKVSIEVSTACNHRCIYCPVHSAPFPQKSMNLESFEQILDKLCALPRIKRISLTHFNEPFLDRLIVERIDQIVARKMTRWIILFTNASLITERHIVGLLPHRRWLDFSINLPTAQSAARYRELHGRDDLERVQDNLERLLAAGFFVRLSVQRNEHTTEEDWRSVSDAYRGRVRWIEEHRSNTRTNLVLSHRIHHQGSLAGCGSRRHTDYLHIGFDGTVFLCGEDYQKDYTFGNLLSQPLEAILRSPKRLEYIDFIKGRVPAPEGFVCRSCASARAAGDLTLVQRVTDALNSRLVRRPSLRQLIWRWLRVERSWPGARRE